MSKSKSISSKKNNDLILSDIEQNTILETIYDGGLSIEVARDLKISLMSLQKYLERNPKFQAEFNKAQEVGIKTLVEKMLQIFNSENMDLSPNELLFLRERKDFLKFLAPRLSSIFQEKQKLDVRSDSKIQISWEDSPELIDVSTAETVPTPPKEN
nr:putative DNA binding protein [uncultured Mediterranean phage uvMED]BAR39577.1 putative DNA binding protein [uncultured Mediterranean phage uvMED]